MSVLLLSHMGIKLSTCVMVGNTGYYVIDRRGILRDHKNTFPEKTLHTETEACHKPVSLFFPLCSYTTQIRFVRQICEFIGYGDVSDFSYSHSALAFSVSCKRQLLAAAFPTCICSVGERQL